jgi:hypothetical protein
MLAPPLATSWQTTHRFRLSSPDSALGPGESSLGCSADSRRVTQARDRRLRTHRVAVPARPAEGTVTDLADIPRESSHSVHVYAAEISSYAPAVDDVDDVVVVDVFGLTSRQNPLLRDGAVASHQRAIADWRASLQQESSGKHIVQDHLDDRIVILNGSSRDPPIPGRLRTTHAVCPASGLVLMHWTAATTASGHRSRADSRPPC